MKDLLIKLVSGLWGNHRKKMLAFIFGLLLAGFAAITGIPLKEVKEAAKDAAQSEVIEVAPSPAAVPAGTGK